MYLISSPTNEGKGIGRSALEKALDKVGFVYIITVNQCDSVLDYILLTHTENIALDKLQ